nr:MAG TPA: hypothetical protein [Caudoviricetes sp.]DAE90726.1 MAG TPA: hypothetical protein [Caudoviricetes sp.]
MYKIISHLGFKLLPPIQNSRYCNCDYNCDYQINLHFVYIDDFICYIYGKEPRGAFLTG